MADTNFSKSDFQFAQLDKEFEPRIAIIFNQTSGCNVGIQTKIDSMEVILLDNQSEMDFFWNQALVEKKAR